MFNFAALRYRKVVSAAKGPVVRLDTREFQLLGRRFFQANAWLAAGLVPARPKLTLYSDADGTGAHADATAAGHAAISKALERWAYVTALASRDRAVFGFEIDGSSNGIAAHPAYARQPARRAALLEAVERFCLLGWWEGRLDGERRSTEWPGISAVAIDGPFGGITVVLHRQSDWGYHCYGRAAADTFSGACERAIVELVRHDYVLRSRCLIHGGVSQGPAVTDPLERRSVFFSTDEGHELFLARVDREAKGPELTAEVIADAEMRGPWSRFARVWRFALRPAAAAFLEDNERYFFW